MASNSNSHGKKRESILEASKDKEKFKKRITETIVEQVDKADKSDVQKSVSDKYEELLEDASVRRHIPSITEGEIKSKYRQTDNKIMKKEKKVKIVPSEK